MSFWQLPFFDDEHRAFAQSVDQWARAHCEHKSHGGDVDSVCRSFVKQLGEAGFLRQTVPVAYGGASEQPSSRMLCVARETLAYHHGLADFAFAMQGLGSGALWLSGAKTLAERYLPGIAAGTLLAAFALSETEAGSDVAAMSTRARKIGRQWVLDGEKTWISNGGIADFYTVFARASELPGAKGIAAFLVPADAPGLRIAERIEVVAPHPLARLVFEECVIPEENLLGTVDGGFKLAMRTLDIFRASVAAAALGFGRRALDESVAHAKKRRMFQGTLGDLQLTQARLAEAATELDAAALLTYRAAWMRDVQGARTTREAAMAKYAATEAAQRAADGAVQLHGGLGVRSGSWPERLYREVRALRIYEGASEVQKIVIARSLLRGEGKET